MAKYKRSEVPDHLVGLIPFMRDIEQYCEELTALGRQWDLLTMLSQMSGSNIDITETRSGFESLTSNLISQLAEETLKKTIQQMTLKAQVTIDILIRNLFERTADIGFLATDDDIRVFLQERTGHQGVIARFREYIAKYSVYSNIILLDTKGQVLLQLDDQHQVQTTRDPLLREALQTSEDYVEIFRYCDLLPHQKQSLIYAFRVTENNDANSPALGVLALCFQFENEMSKIFEGLYSDDWSVLMLLDEQGTVIASSDVNHIAVGVTLPIITADSFKVIKFAGRAYLAKTCKTKGYQGFFGLGWYGHVMIPLDYAFSETVESKRSIEADIISAVQKDQYLFSRELRAIPQHAERIQRELDRCVWNGNISQESQENSKGISQSFSKVLLGEVSKTGLHTKNIFEQSIENLQQTVVSSKLNDVEFFASLAIDIMDRNLYERANDCRWWALTTAFRRLLLESSSDVAVTEITHILQYINSLYTVYTNLFVYDAQGIVLAVSNPDCQNLIGQRLKQDWVRNTLHLKNSQHYCVSSFEKTDLYGQRHTYVYNASITNLIKTHEILGGIGIVFDSTPQFKEMLMDALPRDTQGNRVSGSFGVFTDRKRCIISITDTDQNLCSGATFDLAEKHFALPRGQRASEIVAYNQHYYAVGICASSGYREYKSSRDCYENDVLGFIFVPLGEVQKTLNRQLKQPILNLSLGHMHHEREKNLVEVATFYVGDQWYGVQASYVIESSTIEGISKVPCTRSALFGTKMFREKALPIFNLHLLNAQVFDESNQNAQIIVIDTDYGYIGCRVDRLGCIPELLESDVHQCADSIADKPKYILSIVCPEVEGQENGMLVVLDPNELYKRLTLKVKAAS